MWTLATAVFWVSLGIIAYTYAGYPLLIFLWSKLRPNKVKKGTLEPTVSVVMAARDEESRVAAKLDNLLSLDYPAEKLEIIVVSDGSSDNTDEIVLEYRDRRVKLERLESAAGKAVALNQAVQKATGDILLFCDVRQRIDRGAVRALVSWFADPSVGAVSGELHLRAEKGPGLYWKYEKLIRAAESNVDSVGGATGALYAARRSIFRELPAGCLLDDVYTPMQAVLQGYRVGFEPDAMVWDEEDSVEGEFARKARTLAGIFQLVQQVPALLSMRRNRIFFQFVSHKLMRLVCPFALVTLLVANLFLVFQISPMRPVYVLTLLPQLTAYSLAVWTMMITPDRVGWFARLCHTFVVLNAAAVEGLRRFVRGDLQWTSSRWK